MVEPVTHYYENVCLLAEKYNNVYDMESLMKLVLGERYRVMDLGSVS